MAGVIFCRFERSIVQFNDFEQVDCIGRAFEQIAALASPDYPNQKGVAHGDQDLFDLDALLSKTKDGQGWAEAKTESLVLCIVLVLRTRTRVPLEA